MNVELDALHKKVTNDRAAAYCYIVETVESQAGTFQQTGSGPNFQGDWITLCTCKRRMRTFMGPGAWKGKWLAGFTTSGVGRGRNFLVYLMRVSHGFESHLDLWFSGVLPAETREAKAADLDRLGDIYRPRDERADRFDPDSYVRPCTGHVHAPAVWHEDVNYTGCSGRRAALLIGDPQYSFLWDHPMIYSAFKVYRGQKKVRLDDLLPQLKRGEAL
ncbi:MAG: hypothetical protein U9R72_11315 [Chloroflexota bacterium]|nr:hypothetical protein [Chloroflexota bacterium]